MPAWGRCPLSHGEAIPGWVVPWKQCGRFPLGLAVRLGQHPSEHGPPGMPCIGSGDVTPPLPVNQGPTAAYTLALQRQALEPDQAPLF